MPVTQLLFMLADFPVFAVLHTDDATHGCCRDSSCIRAPAYSVVYIMPAPPAEAGPGGGDTVVLAATVDW